MDIQMNVNTVVDALRNTTAEGNQAQYTEFLTKCSSVVGFPCLLLEIASNDHNGVAVQQSAVIYLKNLISKAWMVEAEDSAHTTQISEQDKLKIRETIIDRIVEAPFPIQIQLCVCIQFILRHDFPTQWNTTNGANVIDELHRLLVSDDVRKYMAALFVIHRLTKIYEYKRQVDKGAFMTAMQNFLPRLYQLAQTIVQQEQATSESCMILKLILKIFYTMIQFSLSTDVFTPESFGLWLKIFVDILMQDMPAEVLQHDDDEKDETTFWKCKKWALKIIDRVFERYGSKGHVEKTYAEFADYYTTHYAAHVIEAVTKLVLRTQRGEFVSQRVIYLCLSHMADALSHAQIWKMLKDGVMEIFTTILFPLMKHSDDDDELWNEDPEAYLREKMDCFEELREPATAAIKFIHAAAKRKGVLQPILKLVLDLLDNPASNARDVDGALHVIAALAPSLCDDKRYKKEVEKLLYNHVKSRLNDPHAFVRSRALRVFHESSTGIFTKKIFLSEIIDTISQRLKDPQESLPVKFEAALAVQAFITNQEDSHAFVRPRIGDILTEILRLLGKVHLDDLPPVVETIVETFEEDMIPIAEAIVLELIKCFVQMTVQENGDSDQCGFDENGVTVMGVLNTLQTILALVDERPEVIAKIEPHIFGLICQILDAFATDYFDECTGMIESLISKTVAPHMWQVYDKMLAVFGQEGSFFFSDSMPCFYRFITTDTAAFLSDAGRPTTFLHMCAKVLSDSDCGDDIHAGAVKMLEVLVLQCQGSMDAHLPEIISFVMQRLINNLHEFGVMNSQLTVTLIAIFISSPTVLIHSLAQLQPYDLKWLIEYVIRNYEKYDGMHDRIMVLYAIMMAIKLPAELRPEILANDPKKTMSIMMELFNKVQTCRQIIAKYDDSSDESDSDDEEDGKRNIEHDLADSDDDVDETEKDYLEHLEFASNSGDSEDKHSFVECTDLEEYETVFDGEKAKVNIHDHFINLLGEIQSNDPTYYQQLVEIPEEKRKEFEELIALCKREQEHLKSRQVEKSGGEEMTLSDLQYRGITLRFDVANLLNKTEEAIAVSCDPDFQLNGGIGRAVLSSGGGPFRGAVDSATQSANLSNPVAIDVPATGSLQCRKVLLVPLRRRFSQRMNDVFKTVFEKAVTIGLTTLALPFLGTGGFHIKREDCANSLRAALESMTAFGSLRVICFVDMGFRNLDFFRTELQAMIIADQQNNPSYYITAQPQSSAVTSVVNPPPALTPAPVAVPQSSAAHSSSIPTILQDITSTSNSDAETAVTDTPESNKSIPFSQFFHTIPQNQLATLRQTRVDELNNGDGRPNGDGEMLEACPICLTDMLDSEDYHLDDEDTIVQLNHCVHRFHRECIVTCFQVKPQCPICNTWYMAVRGVQPADGRMRTEYVSRGRLEGPRNSRGYILITYEFPDGIQTNDHERPGVPYKGIRRRCYLPWSDEGEIILQLLILAFERRLVFTVGDSVTSGARNVVTWNGIHHKTSRSGGPANYGYPDPTYLDRVRMELASLGITEELLDG